jgi:hypothetical protein
MLVCLLTSYFYFISCSAASRVQEIQRGGQESTSCVVRQNGKIQSRRVTCAESTVRIFLRSVLFVVASEM